MSQRESLEDFVRRIPTTEEINLRLSQNLREAVLLRRILKLAKDKQFVQAASK